MRYCIECYHLELENEVPDWSDITPGNPFEFYCELGHWRLDTAKDDTVKLRRHMERADTCKDFARSDEAREANV